jgi:MarR-like DNA-binding transcriptional regulator SgrR of sgrS sRNA
MIYMAKYTTRDRLWMFAMKRTHRDDGTITADELASMADCAERTAREALKTMSNTGILRQETVDGRVRYRGDWEDV